MRLIKIITLTIVMCLMLSFRSLTFSANLQTLDTQKYRVSLLKIDRFGSESGEFKFIFTVKDKLRNSEKSIEMHNLTTEITSLVIVDYKLIIFGAIRNTADVVTLFDLNTEKQIDSIVCYNVKLSDTKRYLIYEKFYPRFAEEPATSSVIMIYDLQASPDKNKIDPEYIGIPIFPEENAFKKSAKVWIEQPEKRHAVIPPGKYLWFNNDNNVALIDRFDGGTWVVSVDLSNGKDKVKIKKKKINVENIVSVDKKDPDYENVVKQENKELDVVDIKKGKKSKIMIIVRPEKKYKVKEFETDFPD